MSLTEFVHHYDKQIEQMRSAELEETFQCNNGIPSSSAKSSGIKKQAGMVYTRKIFNLFESEFIASLAVKIEEVGCDGTLRKFELNEEGHKRVYIVQFDSSNVTITRSCQMYESMGVDANNVELQVKEKSTVTLRRNSLMRKAYGIISKGAESTTGSEIALQKLIEAEELIEKNMKKLSMRDSGVNTSSSGGNKNQPLSDEPPVLNPAGVWPKGMRKMKPPSSEGPSHASVPVVDNSSLLNSFVATSATYPTNQQFPTMSFPVSDVYAPYTLYNQNPASVLPFSQLNLPYANMHQGGNYITQLNQNTSIRSTTNLFSHIPQESQVDSLLGARGGSFEHEATRRMRNEFMAMAAWDGLRSKDSQRILILGATNRPFDLDDVVIRSLPRRTYVDLPDVENRKKILSIFLAQENLEPGFQFEKLSELCIKYLQYCIQYLQYCCNLQNLCIGAAYRPVQELLEEETKGSKGDSSAALRPVNLDDFIQSKAKVGPSVSYDAASMNELRKWNEQYGEGGSRRKSPFGF
ncbi:PREDICTED: uncharacterized protein LOC101303817 [Fragaria vesca subsp. vesca]